MGTFRSKKKAETRMNAGLRPNQGVKVRPKLEPTEKVDFSRARMHRGRCALRRRKTHLVVISQEVVPSIP